MFWFLCVAGVLVCAVFFPALLCQVYQVPVQPRAQRGSEEWRDLLTREDAALHHGVVLEGRVFQILAPGTSLV